MSEAAAAGAGIGIIGALTSGSDQSSLLDRQAKIQHQNATFALNQAKYDADRSSMMAGKAMGNITSGFGASGVTSDSGSVMSVIGASAANAELDRLNLIYGGQIRAISYENQAAFDEIGSQHALKSSYFNALAQGLSGAGKIASYNYSGAPTGGGSGNGGYGLGVDTNF